MSLKYEADVLGCKIISPSNAIGTRSKPMLLETLHHTQPRGPHRGSVGINPDRSPCCLAEPVVSSWCMLLGTTTLQPRSSQRNFYTSFIAPFIMSSKAAEDWKLSKMETNYILTNPAEMKDEDHCDLGARSNTGSQILLAASFSSVCTAPSPQHHLDWKEEEQPWLDLGRGVLPCGPGFKIHPN